MGKKDLVSMIENPGPEDKRPGTRERRRLLVRFGVQRPGSSGFTTNFGEGGIHIQTSNVMSAGTKLHVEVQGPHRTFGLRGRVVWAKAGLGGGYAVGRTAAGMGVEILDPSREWIDFCRGKDVKPQPATA